MKILHLSKHMIPQGTRASFLYLNLVVQTDTDTEDKQFQDMVRPTIECTMRSKPKNGSPTVVTYGVIDNDFGLYALKKPRHYRYSGYVCDIPTVHAVLGELSYLQLGCSIREHHLLDTTVHFFKLLQTLDLFWD